MPPRLAARAALLACLLAAGPAFAASQAVDDLEPVPRPNLEQVEPMVADQLATARAGLDALASRPDVPAPDLAGAFARMGQLYLYYDMDGAAAAAFRNARRLDPDDARWAYYLGVIAHEDGDVETAREAFRAVLERRPIDIPSHLRLGMIELDLGHLDAAQGHFESALKLDAETPAALNGLGQVAAARDEHAEAVRYFLETLELQPRATSVHYPLGLAYRQLGALEKARQCLAMRGEERVSFADPLIVGLGMLSAGPGPHVERGNNAFTRNDLDTAREAYETALRADPTSAEARRGLALTLAKTGRFDRALALYEEVVDSDAGREDPTIQRDFGRLLLRVGDPTGAVPHLRKAAELEPTAVGTLLSLAHALQGAGQLEEAIDTATRATELADDDATAALLHGRLLVARGLAGPSPPLPAIDAVVGEHPESASVLVAAAGELRHRGLEDRARELLRRAVDQRGPAMIRARAHLELAELTDEAPDSPQGSERAEAALRHLREAVRLGPDLPEAHLALASHLAAHGDHAAAGEELDRAIALRTQPPAVHLDRARAFLDAGQEVRTKLSLEQSLRAYPDDLGLLQLLARFLATAESPELRDGERARRIAEEIFRRSPSVPRGETVSMALAELGRYEEAVAWQEQVIAKARELRRSDLVPRLERQLALYRDGEPVRTPWRGDR